MLGIYVSVPIACFRKGLTREFLETEILPPPATCYGFLLAMVGETRRETHIGAKVSPVLISSEGPSVVLRTMWRVKSLPLGSKGNTRPDFQQLLTNIKLGIWLDSSNEPALPTLESRVRTAMNEPSKISRFGGLSLGESTHLVDEIKLLATSLHGRTYKLQKNGRYTLPVWVDHVGSALTRYVTGSLFEGPTRPPERELMPVIEPGSA